MSIFYIHKDRCMMMYVSVWYCQRKLSRKLPSYGRLSWLVLATSSSSSWVVQRFGVMWLGSRKVGPLFPRVQGSICADRKCTGLWLELDLHFKTLKDWHVRSSFGRWGRQNVQQTAARARIAKNYHVRSSRICVVDYSLSALCEDWRFSRTLLLL